MLVGLGNVDEYSGQELERVGELGEVNIVSGLGLVDDEPVAGMEAQPGQVDGSPGACVVRC